MVHAPRPLIAVTAGDPAGIGPEIIARLFAAFRPAQSRALIVGSPAAFAGHTHPFPVIDSVDSAFEGPVAMLDTGVRAPFPVGADSAGGGEHAGRAIEIACKLVTDGLAAAVVTAPISKKSLNSGGFRYPGHTEMLARYLNAPKCQMMMVHEGLRVVPLTRHVPLREVADHIDAAAIDECVAETVRGLREWFGIAKPRIALAGLNPHAGDAGVIGGEEMDVIAPAIERLRNEGYDIDGPLPADAMFQSVFHSLEKKERPSRDAYVTMYHDQGLVPFKMLAQRRGVNVTVGLPVIRTSVDHGVAYDIAGKGIAETDSLEAAYRLAEELCQPRER